MVNNIPKIKIGLVCVSRIIFDKALSVQSRDAVYSVCVKKAINVVSCPVIVETERDAADAVAFVSQAGCKAMAVILGNFGPEGPASILAKLFSGPTMYAAAAEDSADRLYDGRRDSFCGMMNCSYNLALRGVRAHIPDYPIGTPEEIADMIAEFLPVARAIVGIAELKLIVFGSRPNDFFACNAPIKPLISLGVEIEENSELDLLLSFQAHENDPRIPSLVSEMKSELRSDKYQETLVSMAQYELTLLDWAESRRGGKSYVAFANKCWPAFTPAFGFLPCYVHGRLNARGFPVGCETDLYGALSQYIGACVSGEPTLIMDINNTIPSDYYQEQAESKYTFRRDEMFIAFHCGNAPACYMAECELKYKLDRKNPYAPETGKEMNRGTLEGRLREGKTTLFRLQATADGVLQAYIARGQILPLKTKSYGCYAICAVDEMARFYRHVLLAKRFPHHCAMAYRDIARAVYDVFSYLGIASIDYNQPSNERYATENPFSAK